VSECALEPCCAVSFPPSFPSHHPTDDDPDPSRPRFSFCSKLSEEGSPWAASPEQERLAGAMQRLKAKAEELKAQRA